MVYSNPHATRRACDHTLRAGLSLAEAGAARQRLADDRPGAACPWTHVLLQGGVGGISHNPREHTAAEDLKRGADMLLDVLLALASEG